MNFYASPEYLAVVAEAYFKGRSTSVEDVRIGDDVLRLLVVDGKQVITGTQFLDYHEPLTGEEIHTPTRKFGYAERVMRGVIEQAEWDTDAFKGLEPAPYVDWSRFPTFDHYMADIRTRRKGILRENERRRRRLVDNLGEIVFCMDDKQDDVFELARRWKSQQLQETGERDYFLDPKNIAYFKLLREKGLLTSSTLRASGRLLSVWLGFIYDGVWSGWIFTYDRNPELRNYSLGHQLLRSMLEESHRLKHREFDFSIGNEDYKWTYATHARLLGSIGREPLQNRLLARAKSEAKKILSFNPRLLEMALALKKELRKRRNRAGVRAQSGNDIATSLQDSRSGH